MTTLSKTTHGACLVFQGATAAIKRLTSYLGSDGKRLELRGPMERVRAKGTEMVWRADTNAGPRWVICEGGKWSISKVEPPKKANETGAA